MASSVAVVIPVYKKPDELNPFESALIKKVEELFYQHSLHLALPHKLASDYRPFKSFKIITFKDDFFVNKFSYSNLLTSLGFYEAFSSFEFLQIIQLDCWIFSDQINKFSSLGFDYIGAPWMENGFEGKPEKKIWKVGNGGFSLRRISKFIYILKKIQNFKEGKIPVFKNLNKGMFRFLKNRGVRNNLRHYIKNAPGEDIFWSIYIPQVFKDNKFRIADHQTAAEYSFEVFPSFLYSEVTERKLPMGCHNWINNEPDFWEQYISH